MAKVKIIVTGLRKIDRGLKDLPFRLQKKVLSQGVRAGLKVVMKEAKSQAPKDTGLTRRSFKVRAKNKRKRGEVSFNVIISPKAAGGLIKTSKKTSKPTFYPAVVEFGRGAKAAGTSARSLRNKMAKAQLFGAAATKSNPFLLRAFKRSGNEDRNFYDSRRTRAGSE